LRAVPAIPFEKTGFPPHVIEFLKAKARAPVDELSGGQRMLVALAAAIRGFPRHVLLLDEPSAGLDRDFRSSLGAWLNGIAGERRLPILVVSHDQELITQFGGVGLVISECSVRAELTGGES